MEVELTTNSIFILSTSGKQTAIERHNKALQHFDADLVYFTFDKQISAEEYAGLLKSPIVRAGAVTGQGLKTSIIPYLDEVDELAKKLKSVNTVVNVDGELHGYNTDAYGFKTAISNYLAGSDIQLHTAVIYGNGGVSGIAVRVLQELGFKVTVTGRNDRKVKAKMDELELGELSGPYDLVVNATPVSSSPIEEAKNLEPLLRSAKLVFDHNMPEMDSATNYLEAYCREHKLAFIPGNDMYIPQMIKQWALFLNEAKNIAGDKLSVSEADIKKAWDL